MDTRTNDTIFLEAVEQSFLSDEEKRDFRAQAAHGVGQALWSRFNDALVDAIVRTEKAQNGYTAKLDLEIDRFTAAYEKEKTVIDYDFRERLHIAESEEERERLWRKYGETIRDLQARLLVDVKESSSSVLREVILATVPLGNE